MYNLKALGFNTVETYVPWNLHEPQKGEFQFEGILDLEKFLTLAQKLVLYAIVRPSPYICAEWKFGGFPSWLLREPIHIRRNKTVYLKYVADYYDVLMKKIVPHQLDNGGNILMIQIENEYGSFGVEKAKEFKELAEKKLNSFFDQVIIKEAEKQGDAKQFVYMLVSNIFYQKQK